MRMQEQACLQNWLFRARKFLLHVPLRLLASACERG